MDNRLVQRHGTLFAIVPLPVVALSVVAFGCSGAATANGGYSSGQADSGTAPGSTDEGGSSGSASSSGAGASNDAASESDAGTTTSTEDASSATHADASSGTSSASDSGPGTILDGDAGTCAPLSGVDMNTATALQIVNSTRAAMGSPCASMVAALNTSATKHCQYYAANVNSTMANCNSSADPHTEVSGCPDFVGADPGTREAAAGYMSYGWSEVMAKDDNSTEALSQWINSIWHRTPVLDPWTRDLGYGAAKGCDTIDFGTGATSPSNLVVTYPYDGQTGLMTSFNGTYESPAPPMPPSGWPSGYPVHVYVQGATITLTTHEFSVDGGAMLDHQVITPQTSNNILQDAVIVYANSPLKSGTRYRVHVAGTAAGFRGGSSSFNVNIAFTTQ
jgi:hypothetical protein